MRRDYDVALRATYPDLVICKDKIELPESGVEDALDQLVKNHPDAEINTVDGLNLTWKKDGFTFEEVTLSRLLNYAESATEADANALAGRFKLLSLL